MLTGSDNGSKPELAQGKKLGGEGAVRGHKKSKSKVRSRFIRVGGLSWMAELQLGLPRTKE